jgi:3-dehydroquinate dehydratase type I
MICVALSETDFEKCFELSKKFDLSEIRLDLTKFDLSQVKKIFSSEAKLIATCRPGEISEESRKEILKSAIIAGAAYVDIEFETDYGFKQEIISTAVSNKCDVIISYHNFEFTPPREQLKIIASQSFDMGANVAKIACMVNKPEDNAALLSVYELGKRIVSVGMGEIGKISRIASPFLGAEFTFASASDEFATAPGQLSYTKLKTIIELFKNS